jgi:hypothetical protein
LRSYLKMSSWHIERIHRASHPVNFAPVPALGDRPWVISSDADRQISDKSFGMMVARDGVEPPTPAFSGLRSTTFYDCVLVKRNPVGVRTAEVGGPLSCHLYAADNADPSVCHSPNCCKENGFKTGKRFWRPLGRAQTLCCLMNGAGRGSRTPKTRRSADFESAASASSAIPAAVASD